ncbi:hypothetical protein ACI2JA_06370 [Alkalihalobacillus sp. NPDC078783]
MKRSFLVILLGVIFTACGSNELDDRYFSGESDSWTGEILLELKPTTEPTYEDAHVELTYHGEGMEPDRIEVRTIKQYNIPETYGDVSANDDGVFYKRYGNYGLEGAYANGGNFGLMITWYEGEETIYFEEELD